MGRYNCQWGGLLAFLVDSRNVLDYNFNILQNLLFFKFLFTIHRQFVGRLKRLKQKIIYIWKSELTVVNVLLIKLV